MDFKIALVSLLSSRVYLAIGAYDSGLAAVHSGASSWVGCDLFPSLVMTWPVPSPSYRASGRDHYGGPAGRACGRSAGRAHHGAGSGEAGHHHRRHGFPAQVSPAAALRAPVWTAHHPGGKAPPAGRLAHSLAAAGWGGLAMGKLGEQQDRSGTQEQSRTFSEND